MAPSITDMTIPNAMVRMAQLRCGCGKPSACSILADDMGRRSTFSQAVFGRLGRGSCTRSSLQSSSRPLFSRDGRFFLFAAAVDWCARTVPHAESADKGIVVVAGPASFRQRLQVDYVSAADDHIVGFSRRDQSFDHILDEFPPALFADAVEAPVADVIFECALLVGQMAELHRLDNAVHDHRSA